MTLAPGSHLGDYEIVAPIGAGGMGEVYRAIDRSLGRDVAIKVLPRPDAVTVARFEREARAVGALSHPNVLAIHQFAREGEIHYLVTELLEGETLRARIARGPLFWRRAAEIGTEICSGLAAAHAKGIVHRDLKPENIFLTREGRVKILDFGLAKIDSATTLADSQTEIKTAAGTVMGTVAYMSPEQLRGEPVDGATDIFALGGILHEMISGRAPFARPSVVEMGSAILRDDPPMLEDSPPELRAIVGRCLVKEKEQRSQSAHDLGLALQALTDRPAGSAARIWIRTALAILAVALTWFVIERTRSPEPESVSVGSNTPPARTLTQISFTKGVEQFPAWSPDGNRVVFSRETGALRKLFVRTLLDSNEAQLTSGEFDDIHPAWSPDGETILFVRGNRAGMRLSQPDVFAEYGDGDIWAVDASGRNERTLIRNAFSPAWSPDGSRIAFDAPWSGPQRIWTSDALGHNPQQITTDVSEAVSHIRPRWSPDGTRLVFQNQDRTQFDIRIVNLATKEMRALTNDVTLDINPVWSPSGRFIYFSSYRGGGINVWRSRVESNGSFAEPEQVTTGAGQDVDLAISSDGVRLAMATLHQNADLWRLPVSSEGLPTGSPEEVVATTREETRGAWSPDGGSIAFSSDRGGEMNLWIRTLRDGADRQVTRGAGGDFQPCWSPDGKHLVFFSHREHSIDIWETDLNGAMRRLTDDAASETHPFYSPDGRRIAYMSDSLGRLELWIMNADGSNQRQVTREGISVHFIRWSFDGSTLTFMTPQGLMSAPADGGAAKKIEGIKGGFHHSYSPDRTRIMDVTNHRTLWVSPLNGRPPQQVFEFRDPRVRIDYPVWSPDGRSVVFDRSLPEGGDIWMLSGLE